MAMHVGEALVGEGNEVAHIDLIIGDKEGPAGMAFANALSRQSQGHSNLLAVLEPNLMKGQPGNDHTNVIRERQDHATQGFDLVLTTNRGICAGLASSQLSPHAGQSVKALEQADNVLTPLGLQSFIGDSPLKG